MKYIFLKYDCLVEKISNIFSTLIMQVICLILYKIIVDLIYVLYIGPNGDYGMNIRLLNIISGYMAVIIFSYFNANYCINFTASSIMMITINMIYFIPITTYCSFGVGSNSFLFFAIVYWMILSILQLIIPTITISNSYKRVSNSVYYILFFSMFFLTVYISLKYTGFRILTNFQNVYDIRAEAAAYDIPVVLSYLQQFSSIIIPLLILMAFSKKKYIHVICGCFLLLLNFSFAGHKTILFMGFLLVLGYILWREKMKFLIVPCGFLLGVFAILEERFFGHIYIISYFFRRQGYLLAMLSDEYYRFFKKNPTDIFRSTFLGKVGLDSPYSLPISKVIGNNYSSQIINCNNGLLSDVWAHLGVIGILIMPLILIVCFRMFDMSTDKIDSRYFIGLAVYYAVMFSNSTWSTILLTHGFLIMCILFFLFPRKYIKKEKK